MRIRDWSSDVCSSDLLIGVLGRWRPVLPERTLPRERIGDAMAAGVRYVAMSPHILVVLVRSTLFGVGSIVIQALLPLVARDLVGGGSFTYGVLLGAFGIRSEEHTSELQSLMRISYAVFCLKKKKTNNCKPNRN